MKKRRVTGKNPITDHVGNDKTDLLKAWHHVKLEAVK
jgi:hypothetical protein